MSSPTIDPLAPLPQQLHAARQTLIDRLLLGAAWLAALLLPLVFWRAHEVGWHRQLMLQGVAEGLTIVLGLARHRLPLALKVGFMLAITAAVGVSGVWALGMTGTGTFWLLMTAAFIAVFVSLRAGIVALAAAVLVMAGAAQGFIGGRLAPPFDLDAHAASLSGWLPFLAVLLIVPMVVLYGVGGIQRHLLQLLHTLRDQQLQLQAQSAELQRLASHDQLTGLPLLGLAAGRVAAALQGTAMPDAPAKVAFLFVDLDGFKAVNDRCGHDAGNRVLQEVAQRLRGAVRSHDMVARIGGDEFAVVASQLGGVDDALQVAAQVHAALAQPVLVDALRFDIGASIGVALYPDHAAHADALRQQADAAMYAAKQAGGRRTVVAGAATAAGWPGDGRAGLTGAPGPGERRH